MAYSLTTAARNARAQALIDAVGTNAIIRIYSGSVPADANTALSGQQLLATLTGNASQFGTVSNGVITVSAVTGDGSADATATPTFARVLTSGATLIFQCSASVGSGDLNCSSSISLGQAVDITSWTLTEGNA